MSTAKATDKFARAIAIISLLVAIATFALPYIETRRQFQVLQTEVLTVRLNPHVDGPFRITDHNFGLGGRVVQVPWQLILSNTRNQKLSLTEYSIRSRGSPSSSSSLLYTGMNGGMFHPNQKPVASHLHSSLARAGYL
jgi:hypothetical protein